MVLSLLLAPSGKPGDVALGLRREGSMANAGPNAEGTGEIRPPQRHVETG